MNFLILNQHSIMIVGQIPIHLDFWKLLNVVPCWQMIGDVCTVCLLLRKQNLFAIAEILRAGISVRRQCLKYIISSGSKSFTQKPDIWWKAFILWPLVVLTKSPAGKPLPLSLHPWQILQSIPCSDSSQSPPAERSATLSAGALLSSIGKFPDVI